MRQPCGPPHLRESLAEIIPHDGEKLTARCIQPPGSKRQLLEVAGSYHVMFQCIYGVILFLPYPSCIMRSINTTAASFSASCGVISAKIKAVVAKLSAPQKDSNDPPPC